MKMQEKIRQIRPVLTNEYIILLKNCVCVQLLGTVTSRIPYLMIPYTSILFQSTMLYFLFHYIYYLTDVITGFLLSLRLFTIFTLFVNIIRNN